MKTKPFVWALGLIGLVCLAAPVDVSACSCIYPESVEHELEGAVAVFTGTVTSITQPSAGSLYHSSEDPVYVDLAVEDVFKGNVTNPQRIVTLSDSAACGFSFQEDESYLVFASEPWSSVDAGAARYQVSLCSMTQTLDDADETLEELAGISEPLDPTPSTGQAFLISLMQQVISLLKELITKL